MTATKIVIVILSLVCIAEIAWIVFMLKKYKDMNTMRFQSQTINLDDAKVAIVAYWHKGDSGKIDCIIKGGGSDLLTVDAVLNARCVLSLLKAGNVHSIKDGVQMVKKTMRLALKMPSVQDGFTDVIDCDKEKGGEQ